MSLTLHVTELPPAIARAHLGTQVSVRVNMTAEQQSAGRNIIFQVYLNESNTFYSLRDSLSFLRFRVNNEEGWIEVFGVTGNPGHAGWHNLCINGSSINDRIVNSQQYLIYLEIYNHAPQCALPSDNLFFQYTTGQPIKIALDTVVKDEDYDVLLVRADIWRADNLFVPLNLYLANLTLVKDAECTAGLANQLTCAAVQG